MNEPIDRNSDWGPCPEGELARAVRQMKRQRRDRGIVKTVGAAGGALVLLLGVGLLLNQLSGNRGGGDGGLTCAECVQNLDAYIRHSLNAELSAKVRFHLDGCPGCAREYQRRQHITSNARRDCDCPRCRPWLANVDRRWDEPRPADLRRQTALRHRAGESHVW